MNLPQRAGLELKLKDSQPFNNPGRKAATNRYLNILLSMIGDQNKRDELVLQAFHTITGSTSLVDYEAFRNELQDTKGFISGPAYALIRKLVFEEYLGGMDTFLAEFNLRLLQNPERDIYLLGGFLIDPERLYEEVVKGTPNFTDAIYLRTPAQFSLLDKDHVKHLEKELGGPIHTYRWEWRVREHYLEDCSDHLYPQNLEEVLLFDAKQTEHMIKTLPLFDTSTKANQGIILSDNISEVTKRLVQHQTSAQKVNFDSPELWYHVDIAVPAPKGGLLRRVWSYVVNARRAERHLAKLSKELDVHVESIHKKVQAANEASQEHLEVAHRLQEVIEYLRSIDEACDENIGGFVSKEKKPKIVEKANIPRYERLYSEKERRRNFFFPTPRAFIDIQQRIVRFEAAREEVLDELLRLSHTAREELCAAQEYRTRIVHAVASGMQYIKNTRGEEQYEEFLRIIQNTDGYTYLHTKQVVLAYERIIELYLRLGTRRSDLSRIDRSVLHKGAILHDIGKIGLYVGTPGERFSPEQKRAIRQHTVLGGDILSLAGEEREVIELAVLHHERPDGKGYQGVPREEIPLHVQLFIPCDVYSAVRTRTYQRDAELSHDQALQEILSNRGTQFFEEAADSFVEAVRDDFEFLRAFDALTDQMRNLS
ncbi:HD domain-containing protein [Candidatus Woesearchaeota archaeon]|nr:MAG: HD domain-containing protein [Candidatus Woesearchaeota archaeon]